MAQWEERGWKVEAVQIGQTKDGSLSRISFSSCYGPSSRHNLRGPRLGDRATEEQGHGLEVALGPRAGGTDTHRFSLGALFTFEASNTRLALGKRESRFSHWVLSTDPAPTAPDTLKDTPRQRTPL